MITLFKKYVKDWYQYCILKSKLQSAWEHFNLNEKYYLHINLFVSTSSGSNHLNCMFDYNTITEQTLQAAIVTLMRFFPPYSSTPMMVFPNHRYYRHNYILSCLCSVHELCTAEIIPTLTLKFINWVWLYPVLLWWNSWL